MGDYVDVVDRPAWQLLAACRGMGPDDWFPEQHDAAAILRAKAVCSGCKVRERCLEYALEAHENDGVWGGIGTKGRTSARRELVARRDADRLDRVFEVLGLGEVVTAAVA
jgi:WhiB family redox-sensing transcriptional regulator